jgi:hypothetical protein
LPFGPEVGAVCGKAARTVLCGGRAMKRTSLPLRSYAISRAASSRSRAQQTVMPVVGLMHSASPSPFESYQAGFRKVCRNSAINAAAAAAL